MRVTLKHILKRVGNTMKKTKISILQAWLSILFVSCFLISNILAAKQFALPFGVSMTAGAMTTFPITYILSDIFSEVYGYKWSRTTCYMAFAINLLMAGLFQIAIILPPSPFYVGQEAFAQTLGSAPRILAASLAAYVIGDFANDKVFHKMKERHAESMRGYGWRAILSSLVGEICDSCVFISVAFIGTLPVREMVVMAVTQVCLKVGYEIIVLPLSTLACRKVRAYEIQFS